MFSLYDMKRNFTNTLCDHLYEHIRRGTNRVAIGCCALGGVRKGVRKGARKTVRTNHCKGVRTTNIYTHTLLHTSVVLNI